MSIRRVGSEESTMLRRIEGYVSDDKRDFHIFFRERGLALQPIFNKGALSTQSALAFGSEIQINEEYCSFGKENLATLKRHFLPILLSRKTAKILWGLHCTPSKTSSSLLTELVPALESIAQVIRGGPNLYKLNGWVVHVLIGYSMLTEYFPSGKLPSTIRWGREVRTFVRNVLRSKYRSLDRLARAVLHVAMLSHDIGVSVAVEDHNRHGIALLPDCLRDIGITDMTLRENAIDIELSEFVWRVAAVVRLHTFINRLGVEYSRKRSKREMDEIVSEGLNDQDRHRFIRDDLPPILLLVGVADLVAVDDELLDGRKVREISRGYETLLTLTYEPDQPVDQVNEGYQRFLPFLGRNSDHTHRLTLENTLSRFGYAADLFWTKFYNIEEFNFALSLVKFLPEANDTLLSFLLLFSFIDRHCGTDIATYESTRIVFDHNLQSECLTVVITQLKHLDTDEYQLYIQSDGWRKGGLRLQLTTDATGNCVFVHEEKEN